MKILLLTLFILVGLACYASLMPKDKPIEVLTTPPVAFVTNSILDESPGEYAEEHEK